MPSLDRAGSRRPRADEALTTAADDRASLRRRARRIRDAIPAAERARLSAQVCARARSLLEAAGAGTVLVYVSFRSEVETAGLIDELRRTHRVAAPRVAAAGRMEAMLLDTQPLVRSRLGILEPPATAAVVDPASIDAVLAPGLAFDPAGYRLGYGGGYYDRSLSALRQTRPTVAVGLAYTEQLMQGLPREEHDEPLDWIVTERGAMPIAPRAA